MILPHHGTCLSWRRGSCVFVLFCAINHVGRCHRILTIMALVFLGGGALLTALSLQVLSTTPIPALILDNCLIVKKKMIYCLVVIAQRSFEKNVETEKYTDVNQFFLINKDVRDVGISQNVTIV